MDRIHADIRAIGFLAMELMQEYVLDNGAVDRRSGSDANAVGFLSETTSSADELMNVSAHLLLKFVSNPDSTHFSNAPGAKGACIEATGIRKNSSVARKPLDFGPARLLSYVWFSSTVFYWR